MPDLSALIDTYFGTAGILSDVRDWSRSEASGASRRDGVVSCMVVSAAVLAKLEFWMG